jgi:hypothetical protein
LAIDGVIVIDGLRLTQSRRASRRGRYGREWRRIPLIRESLSGFKRSLAASIVSNCSHAPTLRQRARIEKQMPASVSHRANP